MTEDDIYQIGQLDIFPALSIAKETNGKTVCWRVSCYEDEDGNTYSGESSRSLAHAIRKLFGSIPPAWMRYAK